MLDLMSQNAIYTNPITGVDYNGYNTYGFAAYLNGYQSDNIPSGFNDYLMLWTSDIYSSSAKFFTVGYKGASVSS